MSSTSQHIRRKQEKYKEAYEFIDANRETCMKVLIDLEDGKA